jgi:hypothetical protein
MLRLLSGQVRPNLTRSLFSARLVLVEEIDGIEMSTECRRDHTMIKAGVKNESYLKLVIVDDEEDEDEDGAAYDP